MDAHFRYAFAYWAAITKITIFCPVNPCLDPSFGGAIFQFAEPVVENFGGLDYVHVHIVSHEIRFIK